MPGALKKLAIRHYRGFQPVDAIFRRSGGIEHTGRYLHASKKDYDSNADLYQNSFLMPMGD